jgi:hypothetical protein
MGKKGGHEGKKGANDGAKKVAGDPARKGKGRNYSAAEMDVLLNLIEDRLPFGQMTWELLAIEFNRLTGGNRSAEGIISVE